MHTVKQRAFQSLTTVASEIDRHRDARVQTIRDCVTILGDDLAPEIRQAFERYCDGVNALRGVGLALSRNETAIDAAQVAGESSIDRQSISNQDATK